MTQQTGLTAMDTALAYHRAWTSGNVDAAMEYVADDVVCHAPGVDLNGKAAFSGFIGVFAPTLTGLTDLAAFGDDTHVVLVYYPHTAQTTQAATAEYFTISEGKITESVLVFDRLSFLPPQQ